ncbi:MAG: efflux RND transporter periplasmic adaptor subunit [Bryobacteraceae bacterium]|jgi:multidrug efflux pump subunit AcrA (membrane-fusion protein)
MKGLLVIGVTVALAALAAYESRNARNPSAAAPATVSENPQSEAIQKGTKDALVIVLDEVQQQKGHVMVAPVRSMEVAATLTVPGRLTVSEDQTWHVGAIASGRIEAIFARVGDSVGAGEVLGRIHSHEVHEARAGYEEAKTELQRSLAAEEYAKQRRSRAQRLLELKAGSRQDLDSAEVELRNAQAAHEKAQSELEKERAHLKIFQVPFDDPATDNANSEADDIPVAAPASGLVLERKASVGSVVNAGDELFAITDVSNLWMIAAANEVDLSMLHEGQQVHIQVRAYPDRNFSGRILRLGEELDPETRTLQVRILVPNPRGLLRPEMYATASLQQAKRRSAVFVPEEAVQEINGLPVVFVRRARNEFEARTVKPGQQAAGETEILEGLTGSESIVVKGSFLLKSQMLKSTIRDN